MSEPVHSQRSVTYQARAGSDTEYPVSREHLDFILDGIRHMPDPGKIIKPLGWLVLGIAGTAAVEAYNAQHGTAHRHYYVLLAVFAVVTGVVCLYCDRKINKEERKHAKWLEKYVVEIYGSFGITPSPRELGLLRRCWHWNKKRRAEKALTP